MIRFLTAPSKTGFFVFLFVLGAIAVVILFGCSPSEPEPDPEHLERMKKLDRLEELIFRQREEIVRLYGEIETRQPLLAPPPEKPFRFKLPPAARWSFNYEPPPLSEVDEEEVSRVASVIEHYVKNAPRRKLAKDAEYRREFATDIFFAATEAGDPPLLIAVLAFKESSYRTDVVGSRGEIGLMQVHGMAAEGCDLGSRLGQLECGSRWLALSFRKCGDWMGALSAYACGECRPSSPEVWQLVAERIIEWRKLEESITAEIETEKGETDEREKGDSGVSLSRI